MPFRNVELEGSQRLLARVLPAARFSAGETVELSDEDSARGVLGSAYRGRVAVRVRDRPRGDHGRSCRCAGCRPAK